MKENIIKSTHYKLILVLDQLESKEWRALKKFVLMYTREKSDNFDLFTLLRKNIHRLNTNNDIKEFHLTYFPQMSAKVFFNMMSRLTLWVEDWMVYEDIKKSDQKDIRLIRLYNSRGLYKESNTIARKAIKTAKNKPGLSLIATENLAKIYYYQYFSDNPIKYSKEEDYLNLMIEHHLNNSQNYINLYANQLNYSNRLLNNSSTTLTNKLEQLKVLLPKTNLSNQFNYVDKSINQLDLNSFRNLKTLLEKSKYLKNSDLHIITAHYIFNVVFEFWSKNLIKDSTILEEVIEYCLNTKVILSSNKIPILRWHNIISTLSSCTSYEDVTIFIEKYHRLVDTIDHKSNYSLSYAQLCFYFEKYEKIRSYIHEINSSNLNFKHRANILYVISLYKSKEFDYSLFLTFATNYLRQLKRTKIHLSKIAYKSYKNFTLTIISMAKSEFSKSDVQINNSKHIIYRSWLRKEIKIASTKIVPAKNN